MIKQRWLFWAAVGAIAGMILVIAMIAMGFFTRSSTYAAPLASPELTVVPIPSATPTTFIPTPTPEPTVTPTPVPPPKLEGGIGIGALVEVTGTEGDGLRLREEPSLGAKIAFLGLENEVFEVREGPINSDGYEWWYLSNPYNSEKEGWAVANYLRQADQQ
jgi:hypothetical protein